MMSKLKGFKVTSDEVILDVVEYLQPRDKWILNRLNETCIACDNGYVYSMTVSIHMLKYCTVIILYGSAEFISNTFISTLKVCQLSLCRSYTGSP